jgi:hypothetical protein
MVLLEPSKLELEDLRRRERELAALFEIASELAGSLRDSDQVLRLIVKWTRRLLGTDLAYISVPEPDGVHARIRAVDGNITSAFADLRLKLGTGLGGVVAASRMPYASRETRADPEIIHDDEYLYGVAQEEGIVAVVGVPLMRDKVIGVLYAANRAARSYSRTEVALLSSLADHAVVALNNAYLFEEADASIAALQRVRDELAAQNSATRRLAELDDVLIATMLEDETIERLAAALAEFTGSEVTVVDERGRVLAGSGPVDPAVLDLLGGASGDPAAAEVELGDGSRAIVARLGSGAEGRGALVCAGAVRASAEDRALVERAALVTQLLLAHLQDVTRASQRTRNELVYELLAERREEASLRRRAAAAHVDLDRPEVVVVLGTDGDPARLLRRARDLAVHHEGLAAEHEGRVVLVVPAACVSELRGFGAEVTGAVSAPFEGPLAVRDAWLEGGRALSALIALGRRGELAAAADLGFFALLLPDLAGGEAVRFAADLLAPLIDHDADHGAELVLTLEAYFRAAANVTQTARQLDLHPNTVYKRLDRISALLGPDWNGPERALQLHLATQLLRLAQNPS